MKKLINYFVSILLLILVSFSFSSCGGDGSSSSDQNISGSQSDNLEQYWYKGTNFYHVWIKSFCDSNSDGYGDLNGIRSKLDYIKNTLGCDGIWLSPVFSCAGNGNNVHGYDTTNYYEVNSKFGSQDDLASLINECHQKDMKIIFDFVPNHTSSSHPWFNYSINKQTVDGVNYTDWYVWSTTQKTANTNMENNAFVYNGTRNEYYFGAFGGNMPDLNYSNQAVREEIKKIIKHWMDFGFDGMRVDAVRYLYDNVKSGNYMDDSKSHEIFAEWREILDSYESPKFMMCEAWIEDENRTTLEEYLGTNSKPEFNLVLDFNQGRPCYTSVQNNTSTFNFGTTFKANSASNVAGAGYASFLTNHDLYTARIGTVFNGDALAIEQSTALSLMRANVPIIYYGQEIGMKNLPGSGDAALRGDFDWTEEANQASAAHSILKLNKALLTVRNNYKEAFANGTVTKLSSNDSSKLAYAIVKDTTKLLCIYNLSEDGATSTTFCTNPLGAQTSYSTLIGEKDDSSLTLSSGSVTVTNLSPYSYRIYLIGDDSAQNLYDNETYEASHEVNYRTPYDHMYLRGTINSWGATEMTPDSKNSIFTTDLTINSASTIEFKFCTTNNNWSGTNWGSLNASITSSTDTVFNVKTSTDDNIKVYIPSSGIYTVTFDSYFGTVSVTSSGITLENAQENTVYLRGSFSNWDSYGGIAMAKQNDGTYSVTFTPAAGTYEFKITEENDSWNTAYGVKTASLEVSGGVTKASSTDNFKITVSKASLTIALDKSGSTPVVTVSQ